MKSDQAFAKCTGDANPARGHPRDVRDDDVFERLGAAEEGC
ncbi:MAG: hypothetical protein WD904_12035 [Dehalococcoidia bacterium]